MSHQTTATDFRLLHVRWVAYPVPGSGIRLIQFLSSYRKPGRASPDQGRGRIIPGNAPGDKLVAMTVIGIILGVLFGLLALTLAVVGVLGWRSSLHGNPVFGIRVPEVRKSRELWDMAHRVAGPLWVASAVAWAIAAIVALTAAGWMWLVVAFAAVAGMVFLGMGAGMGAHTVAMVDARRHREEIQATRDAHPQPEPEPELTAEPAEPKPAVDMEALRRAMKGGAE